MAYSKPWLSFEEQLQKLEDRGLTVTDRTWAMSYLERIGYYRLSGYLYSLRQRSELCCPVPAKNGEPLKSDKKPTSIPLDEFKAGTCFQDAVELYVFDKRLRLLVLDALERIEVALRVDISHTLGQLDVFAYLQPHCLDEDFVTALDNKTGVSKHHAWLANHARLIQRSKEDFISHHKQKYGLPIAIWVACEVWDFGCMSRLFDGMKHEHQDQIAQKYGINNGNVFASWLRTLNYLRNVCAHHSRLWNRNMADQPKKANSGETLLFSKAWDDRHLQARPFLALCITQQLLCTINPSSTWWERLKELLHNFPLNHDDAALTLNAIGVIEGWETWDWDPYCR